MGTHDAAEPVDRVAVDFLAEIARIRSETTVEDLYRTIGWSAVASGFDGALVVDSTGELVVSASVDLHTDGFRLESIPEIASAIEVDGTTYTAIPISANEEYHGSVLIHTAGEPDGDTRRIFDRIGAVIADHVESISQPGIDDELETRRRTFRKMHSVATRMVGVETVEGVFHLAIDAAENILDFDTCAIVVHEDGEFSTGATSSTIPDGTLDVDSETSLSERTYEENRSIVVDDFRDIPAELPFEEEYRSVLTIPIEDVGVFLAASTEREWFDEGDRDLAELLMSYVSQTISRIHSERALRENEKRYRTLVEQSHDAVVMIRNERIAFANRRAGELFGYEREALEDMDIWQLVYNGDVDEVRENGENLVGLMESVTFDTRIVRADGEIRNCEFSATGIEFRDDRVILATARDVTARHEYRRKLERQNERLEEFASALSHDLRNPLNVVSGRIELARETGNLADLEPAKDALERMDALIEDVLSLARQGTAVDETEPTDLQTVVEDAWNTVDTKDATIEVTAEELSVDADRSRLRQLLENLFNNAVEHGGADVRVTVGALEDGFYLEDDGAGIPEEHHDSLFERGFTTAESGTGFGLAIVEDIAEAHEWSIEAVPVETGARFDIRDVPLS